ncbi:uncharacterized protein K441DRAFT_145771 [Cenococcum geophilum 1.58]|uniref:uncharacterized protein n=1 Tax=Cenococcum geophilum 1.58 TaxID=794803 RepID=UPI00358F91B0|nr:hypothetical protein K441DRAFT_145771 [Cenococcum geophilum 1.58]
MSTPISSPAHSPSPQSPLIIIASPSPPDAKRNKLTVPHHHPTAPRYQGLTNSTASKTQVPALLHQQSKAGRTNSRTKLAAAARRHASPPRSLLSRPSRSSTVSETGTTGVRRSPHQSASSTKRPFPLSDLRRALLADTALRRRRVVVVFVAAKTPSGAAVSGGAAGRRQSHAAAAITRLMALTGFGWVGLGWAGLGWCENGRRRVMGVTVGCKECVVECCCLNLTLFF